MADSANKPGLENGEELTVDPRKAIGQHLRALAKAGVMNLPRGEGRFQFPMLKPAQTIERSTGTSDHRGSVSTGTSPTQPSPQPTAAVTQKPCPPDRSTVSESAGAYQASTPDSTANRLIAVPYRPALASNDRESTLNVIRTEVEACTRCPELCQSRKQTVFGVGPLHPRLVFIGEGPGADEDRVGEPFVGAAGKKLDKIIAAIKMDRSDVYILNTVKCRPPANRNPSLSELDHCWEYAERQLEVLQPEFICCLGSVAAKRVLNTTRPLGQLRQQFYSYRGSRVLVTYHPAYLLRTESANRLVWEDMKLLMKEMGIPY